MTISSIDCSIVSPDGVYFLAICLQSDVGKLKSLVSGSHQSSNRYCQSGYQNLGPVAQDRAFPNNVMRLEALSRILFPQTVTWQMRYSTATLRNLTLSQRSFNLFPPVTWDKK